MRYTDQVRLTGLLLLATILSACGPVIYEGQVVNVRDIKGDNCAIDSGHALVKYIREPAEYEARFTDQVVGVGLEEVDEAGLPTGECETEITWGKLRSSRR